MINQRTWRVPSPRRLVVVTAISAAMAGCSSLGGSTVDATGSAPAGTAAPAGPSFGSRVRSFFASDSGQSFASVTPVANPEAPSGPALGCPGVEFRQGAATLAVHTPGVDSTALSLRYQGSFVKTARECVVRGADLVIKVGIQGRVVVGPAGGGGGTVTVTVPLRYALVREGMEPRTLWTKLYVVPVAMPDGQLNVPFVHVEEEMMVPVPTVQEMDTYVIYVGFDPDGAAPAQKPKPKPKAPRRT